MRGAIFENWVIAEIIKQHVNVGRRPDLYFWRDNIGNELDLLYERGGRRQVVEIKAGATLGTDQFKGLRYYKKLATDFAGGAGLLSDLRRRGASGTRPRDRLGMAGHWGVGIAYLGRSGGLSPLRWHDAVSQCFFLSWKSLDNLRFSQFALQVLWR